MDKDIQTYICIDKDMDKDIKTYICMDKDIQTDICHRQRHPDIHMH